MSDSKQVQTALDSWEIWNALGVTGRAVILKAFAGKLNGASQQMANWQIDNALQQIADERVMPGPTGEANSLFTAGRGLFVCAADERCGEVALVGQVVTALIAGNVVLALGSAQENLVKLLHAADCPLGVAQAAAADALEKLLGDEAVAGIAYCGSADKALVLNRQLATRGGALAQLVAETDPAALPQIGSRNYLLRFITERSRSNNTTAVGGNATLLELGSD